MNPIAMHTSTDKLPKELVTNIFSTLRNDSPDVSTAFLLCCRYWNDIGTTVLYKDVVIRTTNLPLFVAGLTSRNAQNIHSLTVRMDPRHGFNRHRNRHVDTELWRDIRGLASLLQSMPRLKSFSLVETSTLSILSVENKCFKVDYESLDKLLKSLPLHCSSLELGMERHTRLGCWDEPAPVHICETIRALLPQLKHLRLGLGFICPSMFFAPQSPDSSDGSRTILAPMLRTVTLVVTSGYNAIDGYYSTTQRHQDTVVATLCNLHKAGAFPAVLQFICIIGPLPPRSRPLVVHDDLTHRSIVKYDVVSGCTTHIPIVVMYNESQNRDFKYMMRAVDGTETIGSRRACLEQIGDSVWRQSTTGVRLPRDMLRGERSDGRFCEEDQLPTWSHQAFLTEDGLKERYQHHQMKWLWAREGVAGMPLLKAEMHAGLQLEPPEVQETLPPGFKYEMEGIKFTLVRVQVEEKHPSPAAGA